MPKSYDPYAYILRLEAWIVGIEPAVTRTLELPNDLNFAQLHEVMQAAFGWTDSHLHQFHVGGLTIGAPEAIEDTDGPRVFEATEVQLKYLTFPYGADATLIITYQYDFGDDWQHRLVLRRAEIEDEVKYPAASSKIGRDRQKMSADTPAMQTSWRHGSTPRMKNTRPCNAGLARGSIRSASILMRPIRPSPRLCARAEAITGNGKSEPAFRPPSSPHLLEYLRQLSRRSTARNGSLKPALWSCTTSITIWPAGGCIRKIAPTYRQACITFRLRLRGTDPLFASRPAFEALLRRDRRGPGAHFSKARRAVA